MKSMIIQKRQYYCWRNRKGVDKANGTGHLLFIDKMILPEVQKKNLVVAWIDYKKAYDLVSHSCIIECLGMVEVKV